MSLLPGKFEYDYVEYYVGMAKMVAYWHVKALGFRILAKLGPETGVPDRLSYYLEKGSIRLVITSAYQQSPFGFDLLGFVDRHGNGVKRWAIRVNGVQHAWDRAFANGAIPVSPPQTLRDHHGEVQLASIKLFDDNEIVFVDYGDYSGPFMPGFEAVDQDDITEIPETGLQAIDHIASAVRENESPIWSDYLNRIFQTDTVQEFRKGEISTGNSGLTLKVLKQEESLVSKVLVEPDNGRLRSQVQEYLDEFKGAGIQHIAFSTDDIFATVHNLRRNGVEFTRYPESYYDLLRERSDGTGIDVDKLKEYGILCDVEGDAYLLQIFTQPIGDRPTFFYEIVQRVRNYQGFGLGNVKTLFKAVEMEQEKRSAREE